MQSIKIINNKLKIIYNHSKCVRYQGIRPFIGNTGNALFEILCKI